MTDVEIRPTVVELCLALQNGQKDRIAYLTDRLLSLKLESEKGEEILRALQSVLIAASRVREQEVFCSLLEKFREPLLLLLTYPQLQDAYLELLNTLLFTVADKKVTAARAMVQKLCRSYFLQVEPALQEELVVETLSVAARMLRRGWQSEGQWLLRIVVRYLWKRADLQTLQRLLGRIELHMILSCRYDGLEQTLINFAPVQGLYLLLVKRAEEKPEQEGADWLELVLRSLREWIGNAAGSMLQEELELYESWYQWLVPAEQKTGVLTAGEQKQRQRRLQLVQLELNYWGMTKPKTSRKQLPYLQELLEPEVISPKLKSLLEKM